MKPEHHQQIRAWISEEIAALRAQGATDADMHEEAFIVLVGEKILEHHWNEIHDAPELSKALITKGLRTASPETLRQQAALSRERGNADLAYYLEELADDRWREAIGERRVSSFGCRRDRQSAGPHPEFLRSTDSSYINGNLHILSAPCSRAHLLAYFSAHL